MWTDIVDTTLLLKYEVITAGVYRPNKFNNERIAVVIKNVYD